MSGRMQRSVEPRSPRRRRPVARPAWAMAPGLSEAEIARYGFRWGPVTVTRLARIDGRGRVLVIETSRRCVEVWVSEGGKSLRTTVLR